MSRLVTLKSLCNKITDGSHYSPVGINKGFPMLSVKDMNDYGFSYDDCKLISKEEYDKLVQADCKPKLNDLLIAKDGSYLKHVFVIKDEIDQAVLSSIGILRPNLEKIYPDYLKYYLQTKSVKKEVSKKYVSGSALPRIILKGFEQIEIIEKDLPTQKAIAKVLSDLDAKIELNNKINRELEAMAKTIYDYWFVQFDFPFDFAQGKPNDQGKPYKSSGGKMVYNEELKREIPVGWEVKKIGEVLKTTLGGTPSTKNKEFWKGNIPWLNSGEIANFPIVKSELSITKNAIDKSATSLMPKGTVPISITRHLRPSILAIDACANQSVVGIFESELIKSSYIYPLIKNEIPRYMALRTGAQQPHINKETIDETFIVLPTENILKMYYKLVDNSYKKIINTTFQNQQLTALRDWLLPMLMNGQVTVRQAHGNAVGEAEEKLSSSAEQSRSMAAEPKAEYKKG